LKNVETHGTENAKAQTLESTYTVEADAYLSAETAGVTSLKKIWNGEKKRKRQSAAEFFLFLFQVFSFCKSSGTGSLNMHASEFFTRNQTVNSYAFGKGS
jgi:hypothetical protein